MKRIISLFPWMLVPILYFPIFRALYTNAWELRDYTHAYFILPVALFLTWMRRDSLKTVMHPANQRTPADRIGIPILLTGLAMYLFGYRMDYLFISTQSLLPVLSGLAIYLYGVTFARGVLFPILYLLLLVPVPMGLLDSITLPMRHATSVTTAKVLASFQYPIAREGLLLNIGGHEVFMGAPCSGFRSLITMLSLGLAYVYLDKGRMAKKIILVLSIIPLALFGNLVRTITICLIAYYFGDEAAEGFFHNFSGIVIFLIMIGSLLVLEAVLNRHQRTK